MRHSITSSYLVRSVAVAMLALPMIPDTSAAQGLLKRVRNAAAEAATRKAEDAARSGTGKGIDAAADAAGRVTGGRSDSGAAAQKPVERADASGGADAGSFSAGAATAWANYDFVPGSRVLFAEDLTRETVGNFPRRLGHKDGAAEVVAWQGKRWLRSAGADAFTITLPEVLPAQFTLEFDLAGAGNPLELYLDGRSEPYKAAPAGAGDYLHFGTDVAALKGPTRGLTTANTGRDTKNEIVRVRVMADGDYVKAFVNERRVVNTPNAKLGRSRTILVVMNGWSASAPRLIGDIRVAAGGRRLYDDLAARGRVSTQGILFATGGAEVRPESAPTLVEIAAMLTDHPDLALVVEGHTDDVGDAAANLALSQARAEAVRQLLVKTYGVNAARLEAKGHGASRPALPNVTSEGRAANRRVELVRR